MSKKKIVLLGAGLIGQEHAKLVKNNPQTILVGIADITDDAEKYSRSLNVPFYREYEKLLEEQQPDGAIVATPTKLHVPFAQACLVRGIPCLVEKPIADNIVGAKRLKGHSEKTGVPILVDHHRRHSPDIYEARRLIQGGLLGKMVAVSGMWMVDKPDNYFKAKWRKKLGGGPLLINLIHEIDCLRFIIGEIESVQAIASNTNRDFEVEDTVSITMKFENGALGSFMLSDSVASPYSWEMTSGQALYFPHQPGDCYFFGGQKGSLAVPSMTHWQHDKETDHWQQPFVKQQMPLDESRTYENQLNHFIAVIEGTEKPIVSASDATRTLATTMAIDIAAREKKLVCVQEILQ